MREKGKLGKIKKILIRVNRDEKQTAEELSKKAGMNTSQYIRSLIKDAVNDEHMKLHLKIIKKYEETLDEFRTVLKVAKNKGQG
jgi:antitoxin component of RelBE/YafQ-DinJ toxin-antitoxin module